MRVLSFIFITVISIHSLAQNKINPDISLNTLFTYRQGSEGTKPNSVEKNGFALQEAELRMNSNIDTYFRGEVILAIEKVYPVSPSDGVEYVIEPEEIFIDTLSLPGFTIRIGKFYPYWGRTNQRHTHSFAFIDAPQTREAIFGDEGFNETGMALSYLLPTPWYFEFVAQAFSSENRAVFGSDSQDDVAGIYFVKNLWEFNDSTTIELDLGYGHGQNINDETNHIYNGAITVKHNNSSNRRLIWTTEYTLAEKLYDETPVNRGRTSALSSWVRYQFQNRWWIQGRHEIVSSIEHSTIENVSKNSLLLAFVPSEYSALRFQYDNIDDPAMSKAEERATLQLNLTMGAHPAHDY